MLPQDAARIIWQAGEEGRFFPEEVRGQLSIEEGYKTQLALLERHLSNGEEQMGWKVGATAPKVRKLFQCDEPLSGYLLVSRGFSSGLSFSHADVIVPKIEAELMLTLSQPLKGPGVTADQVANSLSAVTPAFEIIEDRGDPVNNLGLAVADNVFQWAYVTGPDTRPFPRDLNLAEVELELVCKGKVVLKTTAREAMDHPLESVAFLANNLAKYGQHLKAGHRVLTGSFNPPHPISRGDRWEARFAGLGSVNVHFD